MAKVVKRKIKGKYYFYLEQNVRIGRRFKKFYSYLGLKKASREQLSLLETELKKKVKQFFRKEIIKPKTEFIDLKTVKSLEMIKDETVAFLDSLNEQQKNEWLEREREKFITNTNSIEGSTLTLDETRRILRLNEKIGSERERLEVLNMEKCLKRYDDYLRANKDVGEILILQLHLILLMDIPDFDQYKGIWRPVNIKVRTSIFEFPHYRLVPKLMKELFEWFEENKNDIHPVELAAKFHAKFTTIHPFADGNGRISRLLMNYILQKNGLPFTNIPSGKRDDYFETQEKGHKGDYKPFTLFLIDQIKENYKKMKYGKEKGKRPYSDSGFVWQSVLSLK